MTLLIIYSIGVAVAMISLLFTEIYLYGWKINRMEPKEYLEDFVLSLFSWITVALSLVMSILTAVWKLDDYKFFQNYKN